MAEALYRKYRPLTFADVTDQNHVKITLKNQIANGTVAHAYMFSGPRGVGKTSIARLLAKSLNCQNRKEGESEPCNTCDLCTQATVGRALDVVEIDAASHTGVDNVRENIIEHIRFAPNVGTYKVFIIDEVHMLSTSAFNALLKTLEEPPAHAIFILATTEVHKIPQTILSRCQRFDFHRIPTVDMVARLKRISRDEGVTIDDAVLQQVARYSEGCLRDAESLLGQILALGEKNIGIDQASLVLPVTNTSTVVDIVDAVVRSDASETIRIVNDFVDQGGSVKHLVDEIIEFVRIMMLTGLGSPAHDQYDQAVVVRMHTFLETFSSSAASVLLNDLLAARSKYAQESLPQLPLEIALVMFIDKRSGASAVSAVPSPKPVEPPTPTAPQKPKVEAPQAPAAPAKKTPPAEEVKPVLRTSFDLDELKNKWKRCCDAVAKRSVSLPMALQSAEPIKVSEEEIEIGFEYLFHFETFGEAKNLKILTDAIHEVMQTSLIVKPVLKHAEAEETLSDLVKEFGGKVID